MMIAETAPGTSFNRSAGANFPPRALRVEARRWEGDLRLGVGHLLDTRVCTRDHHQVISNCCSQIAASWALSVCSLHDGAGERRVDRGVGADLAGLLERTGGEWSGEPHPDDKKWISS
jgi:hypothetical protein